ncbi:methyl-accepting chemotaxis protein [Quadrisphaera setariae]|uniref:methyl-accepting chemotaxis protein n=1 Tax=Quadrisphaera setariae TaxID=2593304 RepID=UPI002102B229|nr:methyl-accepting chemotaxis protein [Quadrisphaera setariae]
MVRRLADLRIAHKLFAGFGVVCLLLAVVSGLALTRLASAQADLDSLASSGLVSVDTADRASLALLQVRFDVANLALAKGDGVTAAVEVLTKSDTALDVAWKAYTDSKPAATGEQQAAFTTALAQYRAALAEMVPLAKAGDAEGFVEVRKEKATPPAKAAFAAIDAITHTELATAGDMAAEGKAAYRTSVLLVGGCAVVAMVLAVAMALLVSRSVSGPLSRVMAVMVDVAAGRLDRRVGLTTKDEVGQLAGAVDSTVTSLGTAMREIGEEARSLAAASASLSSVSAQMASGAQEAAAQTQVVAAASEEVSVSISTVAAAGEEMTAAIAQIATATSDASAMASSAVAAASSAGSAIERLGTSSQEIGDVVKLITSIAEQTNLLALNATIEAARAGELGKGFAVVAGEVKELARQTAQATEEIISKVHATQGDASAAATAVTEIGEVIARIDAVQATIAAAVEEQSATTNEMVRNVTEVSTGSAQISSNVSDIARGTDQNREGAGATADTARSLAASASKLQELTGRFTV